MRRFISISLLLLFTLPVVSSLFAASAADANVRACCRRNGNHHCAMDATVQSAANTTGAKTASLHERCPYNPRSAAAVNLPFIADKIQAAIFVGILGDPACHAQAEAFFRISLARSHQKRGPPSLILSCS